MPFVFKSVEICIMTIYEKPWTRAREVCMALEYGKATKAANIVKHLCSRENYAHKYQLNELVSDTKPLDWPKHSQKYDIYINEEGMYEKVFSNQQLKAKDFRRHCCNMLFPYFRQQFTKKMKEDQQQAIAKKDAAVALLNDNLKYRQHDNAAMQAQITHLKARYVFHAEDPGKDNIVMIIKKNSTPNEDEFFDYPYCIARIQRRYISSKKRWFKAQYPHHRFIKKELDNTNSIHSFNWFEENRYVERFQCYFRLKSM